MTGGRRAGMGGNPSDDSVRVDSAEGNGLGTEENYSVEALSIGSDAQRIHQVHYTYDKTKIDKVR